jgi:dolichol-phosphate mannosyltransferase
MDSVDILIPVFNEADGLKDFHAALKEAVQRINVSRVRFIYVNDGSTDGTQGVLTALAGEDPSVCVVELSRNFGHQAALSAGLDFCDADAVIMMDGDGQHPPELLPEMVRLHELGYDVVQSQRCDRGASLKRLSSRAFYWLISALGGFSFPEGTADFRLISRDVLLALRGIREYHRFYRGILPWLGFRSVLLPFVPGKRLAGVSKYSLRKMVRLASDGIFSFSLLPLRLGLVLGAGFLALAAAEIFYVAGFWLSGRRDQLVPGWSSLIVMMTIGFGAVLVLVGVLGVYVGMIFQEVKRRPVYVVRSAIGFTSSGPRAGSSETGSK